MTTPSREEAPERVEAKQLAAVSALFNLARAKIEEQRGEIARLKAQVAAFDLANREPSEGDVITVDSTIYGQEFYGILNAQGEFWTPLPFDCEGLARLHIAHFWNTPQQVEHFMRRAKIVPVRVQLTVIHAPEEQP